ncbi:MAG: hypothetical protein Ct9H300mP21_09010 [Pseudomonadota bacterium]|nr:MAG: hypothetical protein Ct9H300mP21_09010 [Pseudomonadota bacterium]
MRKQGKILKKTFQIFLRSGGRIIFSPRNLPFFQQYFSLLGTSSPAISRSRVDFPHPMVQEWKGIRVPPNEAEVTDGFQYAVRKFWGDFYNLIMGLKKLVFSVRLPQLGFRKITGNKPTMTKVRHQREASLRVLLWHNRKPWLQVY